MELLKNELKKKDDEIIAKDKHIKQLTKKIKQARKDWITKDTTNSSNATNINNNNNNSNNNNYSISPPNSSYTTFNNNNNNSNSNSNNNNGHQQQQQQQIQSHNTTNSTNSTSSSSSSKTWQLNPEIDSLHRQIKQLKEATWAHQQQNASLATEIEHITNENKVHLKVKDEQLRSLEKELSFMKQTHQALREKYLVQQIGLLDPHDKSLLSELQKVTKEYVYLYI